MHFQLCLLLHLPQSEGAPCGASVASGGPGAGQSALGDLLLGSLAGVVNVLTTTPFWVVNTRLKMKGLDQQHGRLLGGGTGSGSSVRNGGHHSISNNSVKYDGLLDGLQYIARTEGVRGLWAGAVPSLLLVINPAIQFMVYEALKRKLTEGRPSSSSPSAITFFSIGAIAKMIATVLTYPLQLVQTKLRHGNADKSLNLPADIDTVQLLLIILKRQGVAGLYRGLEAKLLQTVLTAALMFMAYEKIARFVTSLLISPKSAKGLH
uniref:Putative mitochondrial carrier protein n=1 Tax=Anopheles triannulatus TaxID=58253 RepID=A0A2M4AX21_9DIPT